MCVGDPLPCGHCGKWNCHDPVCVFALAVDQVHRRSLEEFSYRPTVAFEPESLPDPFDKVEEDSVEPKKKQHDAVNSPSHYTSGGIETIDAIEAWGLDRDFCLANAVKYISRAGKKDPSKTLEDLKKARWYLNRRIAKLEEGK